MRDNPQLMAHEYLMLSEVVHGRQLDEVVSVVERILGGRIQAECEA